MPCNCYLCPTTNSQGKCANAGVQGEGRRGTGSPSLCGGLWGSLMSLSAQNPWGTNVSPTTPDQQCAACHHSRNHGYHPAAGCNELRTDASSSHPKCITDASTMRGQKMLAPFILPGTGRRRDSRVG